MHYTEDQKKIMKELVIPSPYPVAVRLSGILCTKNNNLKIASDTTHTCVFHEETDDISQLWEKSLLQLYDNYAFLLYLYDEHYLLPIPSGVKSGLRIITDSREYVESLTDDINVKDATYEITETNILAKDFCTWEIEGKKYIGKVLDKNPEKAFEILAGSAIATPTLKRIVKNNFRTPEERTLCWTRVAAIISFIAVLISILLKSS